MQELSRVPIDMDQRLQITINNNGPVGLVNMMESLLAVAGQFEKFVNSRAPGSPDACSELLIQEVRQGSIVVELVTHALPIIPLIWEGGAIHEWVNHARAMLEWLTDKGGKPQEQINKTTLNDYSKIVDATASDSGSSMAFVATNGGHITNNFFISSEEAARAQVRVREEVEKLNEPSDSKRNKQFMTWFQARFADPEATGSKAIIETITKRAIKVIFEDEETKDAMTRDDPRFGREWQHLAYLVDVEVQTINGRPRVYKILRFYPEETFDPHED